MFSRSLVGLLFFLLLSPLSSYGFLENSACIKDITKYTPKLFEGKLDTTEQERFFSCLHDALELIQNLTVPSEDGSRDYYIEDDFFKLFHILLKQPEKESRSISTRIFAIKKLTLGGDPDRYTVKEIKQTINLMFDFEKFYYLIHKEIPNYRKIFIKSKEGVVSPERLDRSLRQLGRGFEVLRDAFKREKIVYDLSSLDQYHIYVDKAGMSGPENQKNNWKEFSKFLKIWADGIFASADQNIIEGEKWDYFFPAVKELFSHFAYYKMYLTEKDIFASETLPLTLKSLEFFISSLEYVKHNPNQSGFPLKNLDDLLKISISQIGDVESYASPILSFLKKQKGLPLSLFSRSLICFSLKSNSNSCSFKWNTNPSSSQIVKFQFSDGDFSVYEDHQEWVVHNNKPFYLEVDQIRALKTWLFYWSNGVTRVAHGEATAVAENRGFAHWLDDEFGQNSDGRFEFSRRNPSPYSLIPRANTLLRYEALVQLILKPYFNSSSNQVSKEAWERIVNELSPALIVLSSEGYKKNWKNKFINLFEYGDLFLNSSNQNGFLNHSELLDVVTHLLSARKNSELVFDTFNSICKDGEASCVSKKLLQNKGALSNFYGLQSDIFSSDNLQSYITILKDLLPEEITSAYDFMNFFILVQLVEINFNTYDRNQSNSLDSYEFLSFSQTFEDKLVEKVPYISNKKQAQTFLAYSAKKGIVPFLTESEYQFSSTEFINWYLHPSYWKNTDFTREQMVSMSALFYKIYDSKGSQKLF